MEDTLDVFRKSIFLFYSSHKNRSLVQKKVQNIENSLFKKIFLFFQEYFDLKSIYCYSFPSLNEKNNIVENCIINFFLKS